METRREPRESPAGGTGGDHCLAPLLLPSTLHWEQTWQQEDAAPQVALGVRVTHVTHTHRVLAVGEPPWPSRAPTAALLPVNHFPSDLLEVYAPICNAKPPSTFLPPCSCSPTSEHTPGVNKGKTLVQPQCWVEGLGTGCPAKRWVNVAAPA